MDKFRSVEGCPSISWSHCNLTPLNSNTGISCLRTTLHEGLLKVHVVCVSVSKIKNPTFYHSWYSIGFDKNDFHIFIHFACTES